jgi:ABC-type Zn uptake system ZnuABC Zn-binding protein ZnuA
MLLTLNINCTTITLSSGINYDAVSEANLALTIAAKDAAETAQGLAETAQAAAETAETNAEAAQAAAEAAAIDAASQILTVANNLIQTQTIIVEHIAFR